ncbi:MAG: PASTA domain-containing protein [Mycolicibacterium fortuitum]
MEKFRGEPARARWWAAAIVAAALLIAVTGVTSCASTESAPPESIVVPNMVGLYWKDAITQLRAAGWTGVINKVPDAPAAPKDRGRIVVQHPGGGEHVTRDAVITLQFGALSR